MSPYPEFVTAMRVALALLFLTAAVSKLRQLSTFEGVVANYRLLPAVLVRPFAYGLPPVELLLALALPLGVAGTEYAAATLLVVFAAAMGINLVRGRAYIDCGCFNSALKQPLRGVLVARNLLLAGLVLPAAQGGAPVIDRTLLLGTLCGVAVFTVVQGLNAVLAIPPLRPRDAHG